MKRLIFLIPFFLFSVAGAGWADDFLIPLDDRPANRLFVEQIARIGAPESRLVSPPRHLLGRLYEPGQSEAIIDWLEERVEPGDTVFLSIDMWLYGGLVASRTAAIDPEQVQQRLRRLERLGEKGVFLHVLSTIPRLSLRTSEEEAPHERTLANWAAKADLPPVAELLANKKEGLTVPFPDGVPDAVVMEYLRVRDRNISTIRHLVKLAELGYLDTLILGQDDSHKTGLHQFEQKQIQETIEALEVSHKVKLLSGIDELTMNMVAGVWAERAGVSPKIRVVYSEPEAANKVPPLESLPLQTMVEQHLRLAHAEVVADDSADLDLYVYVPYEKPWNVPGEERRPASEAFVAKVKEATDKGRPVAVADLSLVNRMDPFLAESSLELLPLFDLEAFASWNTPANTVGTVVAQAVCHQIAERSPSWTVRQRLESEKTHQAFLLARFIDDYLYQTRVRDRVKPQIAGLDSQANPLLNEFGPVGLDIRLSLVEWAEKLFEEKYLGRTFCIEPQNLEVRFERSKLEVILPWPRTFEVEARLDLRLGLTGRRCDR